MQRATAAMGSRRSLLVEGRERREFSGSLRILVMVLTETKGRRWGAFKKHSRKRPGEKRRNTRNQHTSVGGESLQKEGRSMVFGALEG